MWSFISPCSVTWKLILVAASALVLPQLRQRRRLVEATPSKDGFWYRVMCSIKGVSVTVIEYYLILVHMAKGSGRRCVLKGHSHGRHDSEEYVVKTENTHAKWDEKTVIGGRERDGASRLRKLGHLCCKPSRFLSCAWNCPKQLYVLRQLLDNLFFLFFFCLPSV